MPSFTPDFVPTLIPPYRSEAFAEDLLEFEDSLPEPEAAWITPYALPLALMLVAAAAWLAR